MISLVRSQWRVGQAIWEQAGKWPSACRWPKFEQDKFMGSLPSGARGKKTGWGPGTPPIRPQGLVLIPRKGNAWAPGDSISGEGFAWAMALTGGPTAVTLLGALLAVLQRAG